MPNATAVEIFERRLVEMGCPPRRLRDEVRELADHYQDLKWAALENGLSENEAGNQAMALLGNPVSLAEEIVAGLRQASWWGRHPIIGFCVFPPLLFVFLWGAIGYLLVLLCQFAGWVFGPKYQLDDTAASALASDPGVFQNVVPVVIKGLDALSCIVLIGGLFWLVRHSALGLKWRLAACAASFLAGFLVFFSVQPHLFTVGLVWWHYPDWPIVAVPLLAALAALWRQRRLENGLAPIPPGMKSGRAIPTARRGFFRRALATPTYWVIIVLTACATAGAAKYFLIQSDLKKNVWPAERAATLAALEKGRRQPLPAGRETTISLAPWLNAKLTDTTDGVEGAVNNNLSELPRGVNSYAGIPFDVQGRAQLLGQVLIKSGRLFPVKLAKIPIGSKCAKIHLLHGASSLTGAGDEVARLVLHYKNGTHADISIISGKHLLDWWGPIYENEGRPASPDTALAWAGRNPWIAQRFPEYSLRLYRSALANPHPDLEIATVDYVSALTDAAPFLLGLTIEQSNIK